MDSSTSRPGPLDPDALSYLFDGGDVVEWTPGDTVICKGDPGAAVFVVLEGQVEVRLRAADGRHLVLCRLGPGELFGELSVLRKSPASADVVAVSALRLLRYPAELFPTAIAECEALRERLLDRLAKSLSKTTDDAWGLFKREQALANLVRMEGVEDSMVAVSARMRAVKKRLARLAESRDPVLITGAPGTGKTLAARSLHRSSGDEALIVVDCEQLSAEGARTALFGHWIGEDFKEGSGVFGALHVAHGGDLILRNLHALGVSEQEQLARYLGERRSTETPRFPDVRIIATAQDLEDPHYAEALVEALRHELTEVVRLPPLKERPRDIVPLARRFLTDLEGHGERELTRSAERALVSLRCGIRNVDELRDVIELAARCAEGDEIRADHIFSGLGEEEPFGHALGRPPLVWRLVSGRGLNVIRAITLLGFFAVTGATIAAGAGVIADRANGIIWSAWEPVVFALFLLVGAVWCTVCPLSTAGRLAKRVFSLERPPPPWLGNRIVRWLPIAGFGAILWVEWFFHMTANPTASGVMLATLILSSVVLSIVYQREVWCRHICPLGRLAVVLAPAAPMSLAASRSLCASTCTTHECYKGTDGIPGCTVFHHPLMIAEAHYCKLCGDCIRSCPHQSTGLYLRPPLKGAWRLSETGSYPIAFAISLLLAAHVFLAAQLKGPMAQPTVITVLGLAAVASGIFFGWYLPHVTMGGGKGSPTPSRIAAALAVLGWGPLMAIQLGNIPLLAKLRLYAEPGSPWPGALLQDVTLLGIARVAMISVAGAAAAIIAWRSRHHDAEQNRPVSPWVWTVFAVTWLASLTTSFTLLL